MNPSATRSIAVSLLCVLLSLALLLAVHAALAAPTEPTVSRFNLQPETLSFLQDVALGQVRPPTQTVVITDCDAWTATVDAPWVMVSPVSGTAPATLTVAITGTTGWSVGTYTATLILTTTTEGITATHPLTVNLAVRHTYYLPVMNRRYEPPWWPGYPLCPGEEDDIGFTFNDTYESYYTAPGIPIPYQCIGWIHWSTYYGAPGELSDVDNYFYLPQPGRRVRITLTHLPAAYMLYAWRFYYPPQGTSWDTECLISQNPGTADEEITFQASLPMTHYLRIHAQILENGHLIDPQYDPVRPYLLTISYQ